MKLTICDRHQADTSGKFLVDSGSIKIFGDGLQLFVLTLNADGTIAVSSGAMDVPLNGSFLGEVLSVTPEAANRVTIARKPYTPAPLPLTVEQIKARIAELERQEMDEWNKGHEIASAKYKAMARAWRVVLEKEIGQ